MLLQRRHSYVVWPAFNTSDHEMSSIWSPRVAIVDRYTQIGYTITESVMSRIYIWSLLRLLRLKKMCDSDVLCWIWFMSISSSSLLTFSKSSILPRQTLSQPPINSGRAAIPWTSVAWNRNLSSGHEGKFARRLCTRSTAVFHIFFQLGTRFKRARPCRFRKAEKLRQRRKSLDPNLSTTSTLFRSALADGSKFQPPVTLRPNKDLKPHVFRRGNHSSDGDRGNDAERRRGRDWLTLVGKTCGCLFWSAMVSARSWSLIYPFLSLDGTIGHHAISRQPSVRKS